MFHPTSLKCFRIQLRRISLKYYIIKVLMFTGIVEECGKIVAVGRSGLITRLTLEADKICQDTKIGDSISVDGVCLTVASLKEKKLSFDIIPETLRVTTLGSLKPSDKVNLERALRAGDRIGGHFVTGHIDCCGIIRSKKRIRGNWEFQVAIAPAFLKFAVKKGSVALDGVSLTIADVQKGALSVCLIPHTLEVTTLGFKTSGNKVNVELDLLAKQNIDK